MAKRIIEFGLSVLLVLTSFNTAVPASEPRSTPAVRAVDRAIAAIVNIHSEKRAPVADSLFTSDKSRKVNGMGTGCIIDERGYIVTNFHVIDGVDTLKVTLHDGSTYEAEIISHDREHDLAIIKVTASRPLKVIPLGTSSDLMLAETVLAVGNPFGYQHTVTKGIISALYRDVEVNETQRYENLIQTDASINPGNSGGPLLNLEGEVIGINVAIRANAQRIGFAIPIDDARKVIAKLLSVERLQHTIHGLEVDSVKEDGKQKLVVTSTKSSSPAQEAGFQPGDIVLKAGDISILDAADLERALLGYNPGDEVAVTIRRSETTSTLTLTLGVYHDAPRKNQFQTIVRANNKSETLSDKVWRILGVQVVTVPQGQFQRYFAGSRYSGGMRIVKVRPNSPAALNGITQGDILVGLHVWEMTSNRDISYVINNPELSSFNPLTFYIVREEVTSYGDRERVTRYGQMRLAFSDDTK